MNAVNRRSFLKTGAAVGGAGGALLEGQIADDDGAQADLAEQGKTGKGDGDQHHQRDDEDDAALAVRRGMEG